MRVEKKLALEVFSTSFMIKTWLEWNCFQLSKESKIVYVAPYKRTHTQGQMMSRFSKWLTIMYVKLFKGLLHGVLGQYPWNFRFEVVYVLGLKAPVAFLLRLQRPYEKHNVLTLQISKQRKPSLGAFSLWALPSRDGLPASAEMLFEFGLLFVLGQWKFWKCGPFQGFDDVSFRLGLLSRLCGCVLMWFDSLRFFLRPFYTDCQPKCASCPRKACDWPMQAEIHLVVSRLLALQLWQSISWSVWQVCVWYSESEKSTRKCIES